MSLTVGELVARLDVDDSGAERGMARAEGQLERYQRSADGRLRDIRGRFAAEGQAMGRELGAGIAEGTEQGAAQADGAVAQFTRDANGRLRDVRGRFITAGRESGQGFADGVGDGSRQAQSHVQRAMSAITGAFDGGSDSGGRLGGLLGRLGGMASGLGGVATSVGGIAAKLGLAVPPAAALVGTLVQILPAAAVATTAILAIVSAQTAFKIGMSGVKEAVQAAFDPSDPKAYAEALKGLSPNARAFVEQLHSAKPALDGLKSSVQDALFSRLTGPLKDASSTLLPLFRTQLTASATTLSGMGAGVLDTATALGASGVFGKALGSANTGLGNLRSLPAQALGAIATLAAAAGPSFEKLTAGAGGALDRVSAKLQAAFESGALERAIDTAIGLIKDLAGVVGNVGKIVGSVFSAAQSSGGGFIGTLKEISGSLATAFASPAVQDALKSLFSTMSLLAKTAAPLLGQALGVIGPVLIALAPPAQALIKALGSALGPIIEALGPVLVAAAEAVGSLVVALLPLLPVVGQLITALLPVLTPLLGAIATIAQQLAPLIALVAGAFASALLPIITSLVSNVLPPLVTILTKVIDAVLPVLTQLITALQPTLMTLSDAFAELVTALAPVLVSLADLIEPLLKPLTAVLTPIIDTVGKLARIFADELANVISTIVVPALTAVSRLLKGDFHGAWDSVKDLVRGVIGEVVRLMSELPFKILGALGQLAVTLLGVFKDAFVQLTLAIARHADDIKDFFRNLPGNIISALGSLGGLLVGAGKDLISGLISGIKQSLGSLGSVLGGVTDFIAEHKGPPARDRVLLTPAGESVMDGFMRGVGNRKPALRTQLEGLTREISGMVTSGLGGPGLAFAGGLGGGAGGGFSIENYYESESGGARQTAAELEWLRKGRG
jgi:phage-related protein